VFINFYGGAEQPYKAKSPTAVCYLAVSTNFIDEQYAAVTITLNKWLIRQQMKNAERESFSSPPASHPFIPQDTDDIL
jgi:hypothetical protein